MTEFVHGGDCASLLRKRKPFPHKIMRHIASQLVLAIEHIHNLGIVHRDIKPGKFVLFLIILSFVVFYLQKMVLLN